MEWKKGKALKEQSRAAITREQLSQYAKASGDFNRMHLDDSYAREQGFPSVIAHGMLSMGFMGDHVLGNFPTESYQLLRLKTRFRKPVFPGDELMCGGTVKKILDDGKLTVSLWIKNQNGEIATEGEAELAPKSQPRCG